MRRYLIFALPGLGVLLGVWLMQAGSAPSQTLPPVAGPAQPPYRDYVAGAGVVEACTQNVAVATPVAGVLASVSVEVGDRVKRGAALFRLDDRQAEADLTVKQAQLALEKERLRRAELPPREEEVLPLQVQVHEMEAALVEARDRAVRARRLGANGAIASEEVVRLTSAAQVARARLAYARAALARLEAGTWKPDLDVARRVVEHAEAQVRAARTEHERLTVRAPLDGVVLEVNARVGEYAEAGSRAAPLIVLGATDTLHLRIDVDENDAWRLRPGAPAVAFVRGNRELRIGLRFVRVQPMVAQKKSLTGDSAERVDTRVLQVIYAFERSALPVYVGQQLDAFIEVPAQAPPG
jgi:multidrug resistance efflux pump